MDKVVMYGLGIIFLLVVGGFILTTESSPLLDSETIEDIGDAQVVTLSMQDFNYYPNTVRVQSGKPVRIYLDASVSGCFRDFTVRDFGVREYLKTPEDYVEFTPTKPGTYTFACSMGMGFGTLVVE